MRAKGKTLLNGLLGSLLILAGVRAMAEPIAAVTFTDKNWQSCIERTAKARNWSDTEQFTAIKCHGEHIHSAGNLSRFAHLTSLSLYNNELSTLDVRALKKLQLLNVASNNLSELQLSGLSSLTTLYAFKNDLTGLDVSGLTALKRLRAMDNKLKVFDITPLVSLEEGYLFNNQLKTLDIKGLGKLKFLDVRQNPMPDELYDEFDAMKGINISHDGNADDWK